MIPHDNAQIPSLFSWDALLATDDRAKKASKKKGAAEEHP